MSKKIVISICLVILFVLSSLNVNANTEKQSIGEDITYIRVAVFTDDTLDETFYGPYGRTVHFLKAMQNYSWQVGDKKYFIKTIILRTEDIIKNKLTTDNFDVFLYPPDSFNQYFTYYGIKLLPENFIRTRKIQNFIKAGGGYYGTCSGGMLAGDLANKPKTLFEKLVKNCFLKISDVNIVYQGASPVVGQLTEYGYKYPCESGYIQYSGWNISNYDINFHSGVPLEVNISKDNAIFDDYIEKTRRIRWISGPPYLIPENSDNVNVIASFPSEDVSENESTDIHYWKYTGRILGMIKGMFSKEEIIWGATLSPFMKAVIFAEDWKMTDEVVQVNYSNMPFMITEVYPNENQARIVRCTGHAEDNVWWGGHIEELEDNAHNNMYDGFHRWMDITPENETVEDEFSYNYWINRRSVAWAAKIPDNDLPPIYGPSQVSDIYPYNQTSTDFTIYGNSETSEESISLDLYFRYSFNNNSWSDWVLYQKDEDSSDGWSWQFYAPNGVGYYEFYSIRQINLEEDLIEPAPPAPDAIVKVVLP